MKTNCGLYKIVNLKNDKVYIGSSVNLKSRKCNHFSELKKGKHCNIHLQNSFKEHGIENFGWEIIKYIEKVEDKVKLKEELLKWEQYYLNEYIVDGKIIHNKCYNINPIAGNNLGIKYSEESRQRMSIAAKNKPKVLEETKEKIRQINIGKKLSQETIKKRTKSRENYIPSQVTRQKLSKANKGKKRSEESKLLMKANNTRRKKVINLDTDLQFNSIKDASEFYNIDSSSISCVCRNKDGAKTAGGYIWKYVE